MFEDEDIIYTYTEEQAEKDGILFDISKVKDEWKKGVFNYITSNLLFSRGYFVKNEEINIENVRDLLFQAKEIIRKKSKGFKEFDTFFSGIIELPNGSKEKIFIQQNSTGKFTIMLPEDY